MNVSIGGIAKTVEITSFDKLGDVKVCMLTTTADGSVGFEQLNDEVRDTIYASFPVDTAEGDIASFEDGADNVPVRKLTLNLVPYQGGSGDPSPNNVRPIYPSNGKNLFSGTLVNGQIGSNGGYSSSTSRLTNVTASNVLGDFLKAGTYTVSAQAVTSATRLTQCTVLTKDSSLNIIDNFAASWHDLPFTFTLSSDGYICFTLRPSTGNVTPSNYVAQVEHGSIATTYVPYNAIGITRTGKNLFDKNAVIPNKWLSTTTGLLENASGYSVSDFIPVEKDHSYWLPASSSARRWFYDVDGNPKTYLANSYSIAYTPTENGYLRVTIGSDINLDTYQIEQGSSATSYEPYQGERYYPISDNPVYGGTLEVETGVLTVTYGYTDLGDCNWYGASVGGTGINAWTQTASLTGTIKNGVNSVVSDILCSQYKADTANNVYLGANGCIAVSNTGQVTLYDTNMTGYTGAQIKTALSGVQLVYPLATPVQYQLTPVQVKTLLGYNNIRTDSGTVEVQYRANIGLYIQKIIGATEDDMVANQNISANKYFFVGEELYYSTSAISAGQTIIVGTNCIKTNLADALNALNS